LIYITIHCEVLPDLPIVTALCGILVLLFSRNISVASDMADVGDETAKNLANEYVKLVSNDNHEFILKRSHALTSGTIKAMLSYPTTFNGNEMSKVT